MQHLPIVHSTRVALIIPRPVVGTEPSIIYIREEKRNSRVHYGFPGGHGEKDETTKETVAREAREEAGAVITLDMIGEHVYESTEVRTDRRSGEPVTVEYRNSYFLVPLVRGIRTVNPTSPETKDILCSPISRLPSVHGNPPFHFYHLVGLRELLALYKNVYEWAHQCQVAIEKQLPLREAA